MTERYDHIGEGYNETRKADPFLTSRMQYHLDLRQGARYLEVGCGTGNYTIALNDKGYSFTGLDPSDLMLEEARKRSSKVIWKKGIAEDLPEADDSADGILVCLTMHHWKNLHKAFQEINRVLKPGGRLVIFTSSPQQTAGYWLKAYFPEMIKRSAESLPSVTGIIQRLKNKGFNILSEEKYLVQETIEDLFLFAGKHNPSLYLDPEVRKGISSFSHLVEEKELNEGIEALKNDIKSGKIEDVMEAHKNELGDYLFIVAEKN